MICGKYILQKFLSSGNINRGSNFFYHVLFIAMLLK
jgi:hypothetical protein